MKLKKPIPFSFILDEIERLRPETRPMFGCTSVYVGPKIIFILREKADYPKDNGVWLATTTEHHESLRKDFPEMRSIALFDTPVTGWQNLPSDSEKFESMALHACTLVLKGDARIGKIPKQKKSRTKKVTEKKPKRVLKKRQA